MLAQKAGTVQCYIRYIQWKAAAIQSEERFSGDTHAYGLLFEQFACRRHSRTVQIIDRSECQRESNHRPCSI